jgi:hypothetical protein
MLASLVALVTGGSTAAATGTTLPSASSDLFGGTTDLLQLLVLAFAGALVVGNVLALVRPPVRRVPGDKKGPPTKPPVTRSVVMITIGMVVVIWAIASLTS